MANTKEFNAFENYVLTKNVFLAHHAAKKPLLIWGSSGNGKSTAVAKWTKELGEELFVLTMANRSSLDVFALAVTPNGVIEHPAWWVRKLCDETDETGNEYKPMVLFLDEITRAHDSMEPIIMEMASDHKICGRPIRKNVFIVAASNFTAEDAGKKDLTLNQASMRRFTHVTNIVSYNTTLEVLKGSSARVAARLGLSYMNHLKQANFFDAEMGMAHDQLFCNRQVDDTGFILDRARETYGEGFLSDTEIETICCGRLGLEEGTTYATVYIEIMDEDRKAKSGEVFEMPETLSYDDFDNVEKIESLRRIEVSKNIGSKMLDIINKVSETKNKEEKENLKKSLAIYCDYLYEKAEPETVALVFSSLGSKNCSSTLISTRDGKINNKSLSYALGRSGAKKYAVTSVSRDEVRQPSA